MTCFLIHELRSRSQLVSVSELREPQCALFFTGRTRGIVAESIRSQRGVNSQMPIFNRPKWRSRCGVNSKFGLEIVSAFGFVLFFTGRIAESIRTQRGVNSQMPIFNRPNGGLADGASSEGIQSSSSASGLHPFVLVHRVGSRVGCLSVGKPRQEALSPGEEGGQLAVAEFHRPKMAGHR